MRELFPVMNDRPETPTVMAGFVYAILSFWTFPFLLLLLINDSLNNSTAVSWCEIAYHGINFVVVISLFRSYLADSFFNVEMNLKPFLRTMAVSVGLMIALVAGALAVYAISGSFAAYSLAFNTLPIAEMELFAMSGNLVYYNPIFGTICLVLIVPFTISLIYYATGFAPACNKHPLRGYLIVALVIAIPRILNAVTFWDPAEELTLYLSQLPFHLIACWAYQKTDTVWAPIFTHMAANLLASILILLLQYLF